MSYYTPTGAPSNQTRGVSSSIRAEFAAIGAGFALLPTAAAIAGGYVSYAVDAGTSANTYIITIGSAVIAYVDGLSITFKANYSNTGASTINVNGLGATAIVNPDGSALAAGEITAGQIVQLFYSGTSGQFQLSSASSAAAAAVAAAASASSASSSASAAAASAAAAGQTLVGTSTTSMTVATGNQTFTTNAGKAWIPGQYAVIAYSGSVTMSGLITAYDSTTGAMTVNVTTITGSGTYAAWNIGQAMSPTLANTYQGRQTFYGTASNEGAAFTNVAELAVINAASLNGATNFYAASGAVQMYTLAATGNFTVAFKFSASVNMDSVMAVGDSLSLVLLATQGATAYYATAFTIDGNAVIPQWLGANSPTFGNASSTDAYTFTIIKTAAATFTVLASLAQYK
jgi:hypothetical protein